MTQFSLFLKIRVVHFKNRSTCLIVGVRKLYCKTWDLMLFIFHITLSLSNGYLSVKLTISCLMCTRSKKRFFSEECFSHGKSKRLLVDKSDIIEAAYSKKRLRFFKCVLSWICKNIHNRSHTCAMYDKKMMDGLPFVENGWFCKWVGSAPNKNLIQFKSFPFKVMKNAFIPLPLLSWIHLQITCHDKI